MYLLDHIAAAPLIKGSRVSTLRATRVDRDVHKAEQLGHSRGSPVLVLVQIVHPERTTEKQASKVGEASDQ